LVWIDLEGSIEKYHLNRDHEELIRFEGK